MKNRLAAALLVIDAQNGVVADAHDRDRVIATITELVNDAPAEQVPIFWVQHSSDELPAGSDTWQYVPELVRRETEPLIHKRYGDSFRGHEPGVRTRGASIGQLFVTGAQTDACTRSTLHGAFTRGFATVLVSDVHTTDDLSGLRRDALS